MMAIPIQMHVVVRVPLVYTVLQLLWGWHLFVAAGKAWPWYGVVPSFNWNETGLVFQSPKVLSKSKSYFLRSCSNFFWCLALRCLQLSLMIDWRSALLYFAPNIWVTCLVAYNVLFGSMTKLLFGFSMWSVLLPCRRLMFLIGKMILSMVIILALKSSTIPSSFSTKNEVILQLTILLILNHIRVRIIPSAIRVFKEVKLYPSFTLSLVIGHGIVAGNISR